MKRFAVSFGRIGAAQGTLYFDKRRDAQRTAEMLQRVFADMEPTEFCRLTARCPRWVSENSDGRFVEAEDKGSKLRHYRAEITL